MKRIVRLSCVICGGVDDRNETRRVSAAADSLSLLEGLSFLSRRRKVAIQRTKDDAVKESSGDQGYGRVFVSVGGGGGCSLVLVSFGVTGSDVRIPTYDDDGETPIGPKRKKLDHSKQGRKR